MKYAFWNNRGGVGRTFLIDNVGQLVYGRGVPPA